MVFGNVNFIILLIFFSSTQRVKDAITKEKEEHYRLSNEEQELLRQYPHALDYQFSENQIKFLEDNGYLVIEV
jgi:hypothetical protein